MCCFELSIRDYQFYANLRYFEGEVDCWVIDTQPTDTKCTSTKDCLDFVVEPQCFVSVCDNGYCATIVKLPFPI
ncbi:unnamed protein product [Trifolium pratense]|uniref:Uncharacterized protein n=1 Tax=Trifolium pratense TaxID=57577 RepID=A0ACB0LDD7_TRIPR|nr:unnamed protein product [Trifolium pratense]